MSRILLGVSGGIAAYKALELVRLATAAGHAVRVVQTPASRRFVGEASFAALTGAPVLVSEFEPDPARGAFPDQHPPEHQPLSHLELVANAEVYLIAPASANTLAKLASGLADNLLSSCALAASCPLIVAPAMNARMYEHPATRANVDTLRARGVTIVEPDSGRLASKGEEGVGRLAEPARLLAACEAVLAHGPAGPGSANSGAGRDGAPHSLRGVRVLVTAGGTREAIDSVRFVGNSSSGRMGLALAQAAQARGAQVTLVAANVALPAPAGVIVREVVSAAEMQARCAEEFPDCEILLMAAAVADFTVAAEDGKIKKSGRERLELVLEPTADVLSGLAARRRPGQTLIGFAAEHGEQAVESAREKLAAKGIDAVVVNDISRADIGFDADANEVTILSAPGDRSRIEALHVPRASKAEVADAILDAAQRLRASG
ncbi:MAG TPA: bifunctional phosphopantothenoylcysteine decarboxylase/phosphopantothenate--cysteine ligase CoaBC [Solirubrobacteraceae bacterium]|jgi:phosphopantothenoylcysteine decarboxylase/phosphopantothenate--cysteine ligase|nr:bifunctional phosphopantothenoylcysteine decarboxylase/phosphopantothenate--cysteine ligase CoaBC [Solirubrobacteraceae bacterium]